MVTDGICQSHLITISNIVVTPPTTGIHLAACFALVDMSVNETRQK
jgi:hypothetical protein